jgi:hypothetical protein
MAFWVAVRISAKLNSPGGNRAACHKSGHSGSQNRVDVTNSGSNVHLDPLLCITVNCIIHSNLQVRHPFPMSFVMKSPLKRLSYVIGEPSRTRQKPKDSDHILSYYQSSIPNQPRSHARSTSPAKPPSSTRPARHTRKLSTTSTSSASDYSHDSEATDARDIPSEASSSATRRSGTPSKGGADRRRVVIVQMDSFNNDDYKLSSDTGSATGSIRSRRGHKSSLAGLALVAPPDAALRTYTQLTPPSTAPISADYLNSSMSTAHQDNKGHHRSASEITKPSSRDVGGLRAAQGPKAIIPHEARTKGRKDEDKHNGSAPRLRETRPSRSPSPTQSTRSNRGDNERGPLAPLDSNYPSLSAVSMFSPVTPKIGEGKEIHIPVAAPVVVSLDNLESGKPNTAASWRSESPSQTASASIGTPNSFTTSTSLRYEPGEFLP